MTEDWRTHGEFVRWKDCKKEYGPIDTTFFWTFLFLSVLIGFFAHVWINNPPNSPPKPDDYYIPATLYVLCGITWVVLLGFAIANIKKYFWRNIMGHNLLIYRQKDICPEHNNLIGYVLKRYEKPQMGNALSMPLGGWFNKPKIWFYSRTYQVAFCDVAKACWRLTKIRFNESGKLPGSEVVISTSHGEKMVMSTEDCLELLEYLCERGGATYPPVLPMGMALGDFVKAKIRHTQELDALVHAIADATQGLTASKRAIKSPVVKEVRDKLIADTLDAFPIYGSRYKKVDALLRDRSAPAA